MFDHPSHNGSDCRASRGGSESDLHSYFDRLSHGRFHCHSRFGCRLTRFHCHGLGDLLAARLMTQTPESLRVKIGCVAVLGGYQVVSNVLTQLS